MMIEDGHFCNIKGKWPFLYSFYLKNRIWYGIIGKWSILDKMYAELVLSVRTEDFMEVIIIELCGKVGVTGRPTFGKPQCCDG